MYIIDLYTGTSRETVLHVAYTRIVLSRDCLSYQDRLVELYAVSAPVVEIKEH